MPARPSDFRARLEAAATPARAAEQRGDWRAADEAWHRYRLVLDAQRDPDDLLRPGLQLSRFAIVHAESH